MRSPWSAFGMRSGSRSTSTETGARNRGDGLDRYDEIGPRPLTRALLEQTRDLADDSPELVVAQRPDQDAACMRTTPLGPLPQDRREVAAVASDENAMLGGREREHLWIGEPFERLLLCQRDHVVTPPAERFRHVSRREVCVEQELHACAYRRDATWTNG